MNSPHQDTTDQLVLTAQGVCKSYSRGGDAPVLSDVDLSIRRGECVFLAGPSGSGKSTLLSILGCILTPDRGTVRILGENIGQFDDRRRALVRRERIGFVFQRFHLIRGLTALENVCVPMALRGPVDSAGRDRGRYLLERVGLANKLRSYPNKLSAGQSQRVALARAMALDPDLLLADEPTASLDAENGQQVMELLRELTAGAGKAAVVVTHDQRIFHYADRVLQLDNGRIRSNSPGEQRAENREQNRASALAEVTTC